MLLTVTSNPAIDRTLHLPRLEMGTVHRASRIHLTAGGKGLNVARAAHSMGQEVLATGPLAGHCGRLVAQLAAEEGLSADWFWAEHGETRCSLLLTHEHGDATVINEPGPELDSAIWGRFADHVRRLASLARAVALSSSLPPGVPPDALAELARSLAASGVAAYLDTSDVALTEALRQPKGICIKVNRHELAEAWGAEIDQKQLLEVGKEILSRGAKLVVVSLGEEGALAIAKEGAWHARAPRVAVQSTVGSGDSLMAGLAARRLQGARLESALGFGVACGSANARTRYPGRFERKSALELERQVSIEELK